MTAAPRESPGGRPLRILLGQLERNGDCLYATAIARQIKTDYPGCHLTWAIKPNYRSVLDGNPYVDEVWEIPFTSSQTPEEIWEGFRQKALAREKNGEFDRVFLTQFWPGNLHRFDGTLRSSIFRGYPGRITVPVAPVLRLRPGEVENVRQFAERNRLKESTHVILFECGPKSGQSAVTPEGALVLAERLVGSIEGVSVILSSDRSIPARDFRIVDGSVLSFRENAELTKYCTLLVGCSSGISWIATSDWAKPLPMIQLVNADPWIPSSMLQDFEEQGLPTDLLIEMTEFSPEKVYDCIKTALGDFKEAKRLFNTRIPRNFNTYRNIHCYLLEHRRFAQAFELLKINIRRYGFDWKLIRQVFHPVTDLKRKLLNALHLLRVALRLPKMFQR